MALKLDDQISKLNGVGKVTEQKLLKLGIKTIRDLIFYFPRAYERRGAIRNLAEFDPENACSFLLTVSSEVHSVKVKNGITISKFNAFDDSGKVEVVFFNSPFVKDVFHIGSVFRFFGKVSLSKRKLQITSPKYEPYIEGLPLPDFVPVYPLTNGLSSKVLENLIKRGLQEILAEINDPLPDSVRIDNSLPTLSYAVKNAHFPDSNQALEKSFERLAFNEMFYLGLGISLSASRNERGNGVRFSPCSLEPVTSSLPYSLTTSQKMAVNDIYKDTVIGKNGKISPMTRIIVGDVGCGKTICATLAAFIAFKSGYQTAFMAPTEILARQHYIDISNQLSSTGARVELLLGSTTEKNKKIIRERLSKGEIDILIGTHTLISEKTDFCKLGLIITDEQHRFGVAQRSVLKEKTEKAHLLVMSATPIPRSLALALYGDLNISRITDMPKGRQRVDTFVIGEDLRHRLNKFILNQTNLKKQCYVVCPSIEGDESEDTLIADSDGKLVSSKSLNLKNVNEYAKNLQAALPSVRVAVLHGKLRAFEKDEIMERFVKGEIDVLVSTTVIEVGVNVPNATLMIVENAERFGLSQLHQLRGRVGRGNDKSYCVLVSDTNSEKSRARLEVIRTVYDGYTIAENDLVLRGPGDFFINSSSDNMRQSGGFEFKFASKFNTTELYERAFGAAKNIIDKDPDLCFSEHQQLRDEIESYLNASTSTIS